MANSLMYSATASKSYPLESIGTFLVSSSISLTPEQIAAFCDRVSDSLMLLLALLLLQAIDLYFYVLLQRLL